MIPSDIPTFLLYNTNDLCLNEEQFNALMESIGSTEKFYIAQNDSEEIYEFDLPMSYNDYQEKKVPERKEYDDYDDYEEEKPKKALPYDIISRFEEDFTLGAKHCSKKIIKYSALFGLSVPVAIVAIILSFIIPTLTCLGLSKTLGSKNDSSKYGSSLATSATNLLYAKEFLITFGSFVLLYSIIFS